MATTRRQQRVNQLLQQEISRLLEFESDDPRLARHTVSPVEVYPDLRQTRVYIVALDDPEQEKEVRHGLRRATPFLRHELSRRIQLRLVPELEFSFDHSFQEGDRIERLLRQVKDDLQSE